MTKFAIKIVAACALAIWANTAFSQNLLAAEPRNVVQLVASGQVEVQQDLLTITLTATKEGSDASMVQTYLSQTLEAGLAEAKRTASAQAMEVRTGAFGLQPRYGRDGRITGWVGNAEMVLEGRDFGKIGSAAGRIQNMTVANASFGLSRELRNRTEAQAQEIAIDRFKSKAQEIARSFGFGAYTLRDVSVSASDQGYSPRPRLMAMEMRAASADVAMPVEAGKSAVVVNVNGSVQLK
jgi:predicted secreted protein